ncbi:hypothetical protein DB346_06765 [Verrucomicrobia bacterium LW23]|nr:hypothetical protein DB346_06765 [Verrucomicrobia bacterium LW23]
MKRKSSTITVGDIATRVGLSRQTVSYILNEKGHLFRPETRRLVIEAAEDLGYRPNAVAKALRSGKFNGIGLVSSAGLDSGTVTSEKIFGIHEVLQVHDFHLVSARYSDEFLVSRVFIPKMLRELMVDGLIVNYTHRVPPELVQQVENSPLPTIWLNVKQPYDCVRPDDFQGGALATSHLLKLGHQDIAFVDVFRTEEEILSRDTSFHYSVRDRWKGYEAAMRGAGQRPRLFSRNPRLSPSESKAGPFDWLEGPRQPTALLFSSEGGLMPALMQMAYQGRRIPQDISVMCFQDGERTVGGGYAVDYVLVPHRLLGATAAELLIKKIQQNEKQKDPVAIIPCKLCAAGYSVGPPPAKAFVTQRKRGAKA